MTNHETDESTEDVDELLESLGLDASGDGDGHDGDAAAATTGASASTGAAGTEPGEAGTGQGGNDDPPLVSPASTRPADPSRFWAPVAAVLGLGLIVAIGALIWVIASDDEAGTATDAGIEVGTARSATPSIDDEAGKLWSSITALGLSDRLDVVVRGSVIYVEGSVGSQADVDAVYGAASDLADGVLVDTSGLMVAGGYGEPAPGAGPPPPGAGPPPGGPPPPGGGPPPPPPPNEPRLALQQELDRVLEATPLVFDSGATELTDLQRRVLDSTVVNLIFTYPGIPVRVVGYTDEAGDEDANSLLSIERANAVRDHLILQGVPAFALIAEGRGETASTGSSELDRRVELEVVLLDEEAPPPPDDG